MLPYVWAIDEKESEITGCVVLYKRYINDPIELVEKLRIYPDMLHYD
jgi:hypothetical protein